MWWARVLVNSLTDHTKTKYRLAKLPGTHLKTFKVQLLGPTLTHFFSLQNTKNNVSSPLISENAKLQETDFLHRAIANLLCK